MSVRSRSGSRRNRRITDVINGNKPTADPHDNSEKRSGCRGVVCRGGKENVQRRGARVNAAPKEVQKEESSSESAGETKYPDMRQERRRASSAAVRKQRRTRRCAKKTRTR